ncbi:MAG: M3 family oligoendopeptidase, partial [Chloroflexi bacterium]|nr:M3 family oligoendopeptidase [Chloroflexota bacterium]
LFRESNVPLETEQDLLTHEYQAIMGALTVQFDGAERTLAQMGPIMEETDRARREAAFRAVGERRYQEREKLDALFDQLRDLRAQMAANADYANYRDYMFDAMLRFDYTPADCFSFHSAVETHVVPLIQKIYARRRAQMQLDSLRPWDTQPDPLGRPPLRPFKTARELIDGCARIFERVDPQLGSQFRQLDDSGLLDLENRKGKAPGGYQEFFNEARLPFIFMNAVGAQYDVETLLHEGGHAFNALAARSEWLGPYRHPPLEFAEVASMGMELIAADYLEEFHAPADAARARNDHLEGIVTLLGWIATVDAFQHWLYTYPRHTQAERAAQWAQTYRRFNGAVDWRSLEHFLQTSWHRQLHIFEVPFYYIEYGIAQLGALQVWRNMRQNRAAAVAAYRRALAVGGSRPLPDIYAAAGIQFRFDAEIIAPLMEMLAKELAL